MKYYKYPDEWVLIDDAITYIETENGAEYRRITYNGTIYLASNVLQANGQIHLADTVVDYDKVGGNLTVITKQEFEGIWQTYLATRQTEWNQVKETYPVGVTVDGFMYLFLPQGVIVHLRNNALGLADYWDCRRSTEPQFMYPRHRITAVVKGYDEENQWVILDSPSVYQERKL